MSSTTVSQQSTAPIALSKEPVDKGKNELVALIAEGIGTFGLVFAGCGAIVIDTLSRGQVTHVGVSLVFGLIITVMIYALGHISGAHLNPAVSLAFVLVRHFPVRKLFGYWLAQLLGAICAALCLRLLFGNVAHLGTTLPQGSNDWQSFGLEAILTYFLMLVIMAMATDTRAVGQAAALAIGGTVGLEALFAGPISGASMNPVRSLAPALISWTWTAQWVYVLAPLLGAIAGAYTYHWLRELDKGKLPKSSTTESPSPIHHRSKTSMTEAISPTHFIVPYRVLFLCTHNSSRSQMAEGLLRARGGADFQVFSAGTQPRTVHPLTIRVMAEIGIDISEQAGYRAKGIEEFVSQASMDLVITVCDEAAEACPFFPNARQQVHWGFPDPSRVTGSEEERLAAFRHIRDLIAVKINQFLGLHPTSSLQQLYEAAGVQEREA